MTKMTGKVCIVTGAAMGLGKADSKLLIEEGASVILTDINKEAGEETARELGDRASFYHHDVANEEHWQSLMEHVLAQHGRLDALVNNAGIVKPGSIETASADDWRQVLAVNLDGTFFGCKHAVAAMKESGGSIINMSSTAALVGIPSVAAYSAAKGAIRSLTKSIAIHCLKEGYNIRCNSVHPGNMDTPMLRKMLGQSDQEDDMTSTPSLSAHIGSPDEVARMVLFLASDDSHSVTGAEMVVDRGLTAMQGTMPA